MERKDKSGDKVPGDKVQDIKQSPLSSSTAEPTPKPTLLDKDKPVETIKINPIFQMLKATPNWENAGIELLDKGSYITFRRGNIVVNAPYHEVMVFGAKVFYNMFMLLDK